MTFWIIIFCLAVAVTAPLTLVLLRRRGDRRSSAEFDIAVYRDQLRDVDRDLERGVIARDVAERTRIEVSRRILDADRARAAATAATAPPGLTRIAVGLTVLVLVAGSLLVYRTLGAPGYGDLALKDRLAMAQSLRENRPDQATAEGRANLPTPPAADPEYVALVQRLRDTVTERPDEPRGFQLLAQNEANLGNFIAAYEAQRRLLELVGDTAPGQAWAELAEFYVLAAGGYVSPEAEEALTKALELDPANAPARYYIGQMFQQTGRPDVAFGYWRNLLESSPADSPWVPAIRAQIEDVAMRAGVRYSLPPAAPALPGPTGADMAAAQDMSPEDRQAMIRSMVDGLAERLGTEGGSPTEWARLISALGVLGETDRAQAIYDEARATFGGTPAALAEVRAAAERAGLSQ